MTFSGDTEETSLTGCETTITSQCKGKKLRILRKNQSIGEYLARLSSKYDVYSGEFFNALLAAGENRKSNCGSLSIECRSKTKSKITFLIKRGSEVVAQFPVPTEFLLETGNPLLNFIDNDKIHRPTIKKTETGHSCCIRDLRAGMSNVNLKAKVLEVTAPKCVTTRYGNYATLAKALIGDETGKIQLCLWNTQTNSVSVGDTIVIENARASRFGDKTQLSIGTKSKLTKEASPPLLSHSLNELLVK